MNKPKMVHGLNSQHALGHVKARNILREGIVLNKHSHQVSARKKLHDQIQIGRVLERVEQLDDPRRVGFRKNVALRANVRELGPRQYEPAIRQHTIPTWSFFNISSFFSVFIA